MALGIARKPRTLERRLLAILDASRDRREAKRPLLASALTVLTALLAVVAPLRLTLDPQVRRRPAASIREWLDDAGIFASVGQDPRRGALEDPGHGCGRAGREAALEGACGMLEAMHDPYSSYLPASDATELSCPLKPAWWASGFRFAKVMPASIS